MLVLALLTLQRPACRVPCAQMLEGVAALDGQQLSRGVEADADATRLQSRLRAVLQTALSAAGDDPDDTIARHAVEAVRERLWEQARHEVKEAITLQDEALRVVAMVRQRLQDPWEQHLAEQVQ
eukprot:COSAG05_NODE_3102_length_2321_cov_1.380288_1_plen_124_part_00